MLVAEKVSELNVPLCNPVASVISLQSMLGVVPVFFQENPVCDPVGTVTVYVVPVPPLVATTVPLVPDALV